jgi:hypothetical protein
MMTFWAVRGPDAGGAADRRHVAVQDRALEHRDAGGAQDRQADLRAHPVDLDEQLEQLQVLRSREAEERELVLPDVRVDVELDLVADGADLLAGRGRDAQQVADTTGLHDDLLARGAHDAASEVADHRPASTTVRRRRLRTWHSAIASASAACSSSLALVRTWSASMRAICVLSAIP